MTSLMILGLYGFSLFLIHTKILPLCTIVTSSHAKLNLYGLLQVACAKGSERFTTAAFHPDGHVIGTGTSRFVRFWDVSKQV